MAGTKFVGGQESGDAFQPGGIPGASGIFDRRVQSF